ncbi:MAG: hypothetical protein ABIL25_02680 [candidate division WOR-3 bacterium]
MRQRGECLPIEQVLDTVLRVEKDVIGFYRLARDLAGDDAAKRTFERLLEEKETNLPDLQKVCREIECDGTALANATQEDLVFLSALAETSFYRQVGNPAELADPALDVQYLVDNALKLEKDLMLFYVKFYGVSCAAHKLLFSKMIQMSQRQIAELNNTRARLGATS